MIDWVMRSALLVGVMVFACHGDDRDPIAAKPEVAKQAVAVAAAKLELEAARQDLLLVNAEVLVFTVEHETNRTTGTPAQQLTSVVALRDRLMQDIEELAGLVTGGSTEDVRARAKALHKKLRQQVPKIDAEVRWLKGMAEHEAPR